MIKIFIITILLTSQLVYANGIQILPKSEQLIELKKIDSYYKSQKQATPSQVTEGIIKLEKELGIDATKQQPIVNKPKTKTVCKKIKAKTGKYINQCKTIKIHQKYDGKPVPNQLKK